MKFGFKKAVDGICHCYGFIIHGVLIYVFKHVVCRVTRALHCVLIWDIEPEHDRRVYMAQVVEAERLNSAASARALQMLIQDVPGRMGNILICVRCFVKQPHNIRRHFQFSVSAVRFRLLELRTVLTVYHCLLDCQDITVKTIPCQTSDLRCTEAEPDSQKERQFKVCALAECYRVIDQNIRLLPAKLLSQLT